MTPLNSLKREDLDTLAEQNGLDPADYSNKDDLAADLEARGVSAPEGAGEADQSPTVTDEPRDPSQAIPPDVLPRHLAAQPAGPTRAAASDYGEESTEQTPDGD